MAVAASSAIVEVASLTDSAAFSTDDSLRSTDSLLQPPTTAAKQQAHKVTTSFL
jgi:hypothetical protein